VFQYCDRLKFIHRIGEGESYLVSGILRNSYFTGMWSDTKKIGYDGVFQMKLNGKGNKFEGMWCGWTNTGSINGGPCYLEKLVHT
jgi:hypothetical protein